MTSVRALLSDSALDHGSRSKGLGGMVQEPRTGFYVAEWGVFCHSAWLQISPARFKQVYSDRALRQAYRPISAESCPEFTSLLPYALAAFFYSLICRVGSVVKRPKPFVPWHLKCAVVAFEEAVMQLVMKISGINSFLVF